MITPVTEEDLKAWQSAECSDFAGRVIAELRALRVVADAAQRQWNNCGCCCNACCDLEMALEGVGPVPTPETAETSATREKEQAR